jgi:hypothetical protein
MSGIISTTSNNGNSSGNGLLWVAALGGLVVGGLAGAVMTAKLWSRNEDDDKRITEKQQLPPGVKSRSLDSMDSGAAMSSSWYNASLDQATTTHVNFLSDILDRLWPYINRGGCQLMRETMEPMFAETLPSPLQSLRFVKLDLGTIPIVVDNILVHERKTHGDKEYVVFEWDVTWHSSSDMQLATSNGMIQFGVKDIRLTGRMVFWMQPLSNEIPCIDAIQYAFVNPPELELDFTGLANVADFNLGIDMKGTIRTMMQDVLAGIMVLPVKMLYVMNPGVDYRDIYQPTFLGLA